MTEKPDEKTVKSVFETLLKESYPDIYATMKKEHKFKGIGTRCKWADYYFEKWFEKDAVNKIAIECKGSRNRTTALGQVILYRYAISQGTNKRKEGRAAMICAKDAAQPYLRGVCRENKILLYGVDVEAKMVYRMYRKKERRTLPKSDFDAET